MTRPADFLIIGGGIVGLATAWQLRRQDPGARIVVVEKENAVGQHQTGHNSGVLHTGIYYKPGSRKAQLCTQGRRAMVQFCEEHGIPFEICGKVIVATEEEELPRLGALHDKARANGVRCEEIGPERLREIEPHVAGIRALHVPDAGIVDYRAVVRKLAALLEQDGATVHTGRRVIGMRETATDVAVETTDGALSARRVINCGGLHSDRIARQSGMRPPAQIVPFRGEYFEFKPGSPQLCQNLIYPVPDPEFPFLGVHFTRMIGGGVEAGPNAVLAFAREGYTKLRISPRDLFGTLTYPGFLRLAARHWRAGAGEMWRSWSKRAFVKALQRLIPEVRGEQLTPAPAGVRAQALRRDGGLVDDFLIERTARMTHVCNAPSPAATASLAIGATLASDLATPTA